MPPVTPQRRLKSCLTSSSPSDCSSPTTSSLSTTATPRTPALTNGSSSNDSTPSSIRRHKKSVRFREGSNLHEVRLYEKSISITATTTTREVPFPEVRTSRKRKGSRDDLNYYEETSTTVTCKVTESTIPKGLGIIGVDGAYGPPPSAPPTAPLPRPRKRERTKYSPVSESKQTEQKKTKFSFDDSAAPPYYAIHPSESKLNLSFDDSTSTPFYPDRSFGQAPPPPVAMNTSFTELAQYPAVPAMMSSGWSFMEQPEEPWYSFQEQPPCVAASSARTIRRKRSFEGKRVPEPSRHQPPAPEYVDVASLRSRRGSSVSKKSSMSSVIPSDYQYSETTESSRRSDVSRQTEEDWAENFRLENMKRQARQKTRDREIKKHYRKDPFMGSFEADPGVSYYDPGACFSFNADEGFEPGRYY